MNSDSFIRSAAPLAGAAALVGIPADLYHLTIDSRVTAAGSIGFKLHGLALVAAFGLTMLALVGLALRMGDRLGAAGRIGVPVAFAGTLLAVVNIGTEAFAMQLAPEALGDPSGYPLVVIIVSFALFSLGWLLVGVAAARSGLGSSPAAVLLIVGALIGFTPLPGSYVLMLAGIALTARTLTAGEPASVRGAASRTGAAHA